MFTRGHKVTMESLKGAWSVSFDEPTGKHNVFNFKNVAKEGETPSYQCEIPTEVWYLDYFKQEQQQFTNFAQHLLDSYNKKDQYGEVTDPHLRVVKITKPKVVEAEVVKEAPISKRKSKEKESETVNS